MKKNCPLVRGVRLLECPLIGENTVVGDVVMADDTIKIINIEKLRELISS